MRWFRSESIPRAGESRATRGERGVTTPRRSRRGHGGWLRGADRCGRLRLRSEDVLNSGARSLPLEILETEQLFENPHRSPQSSHCAAERICRRLPCGRPIGTLTVRGQLVGRRPLGYLAGPGLTGPAVVAGMPRPLVARGQQTCYHRLGARFGQQLVAVPLAARLAHLSA